jgi:chaperonin cofactor prefoldin
MIKSKKEKIEEDLKEKKKLLELRLKNIETQEESMTKDMEKMRGDLINNPKKDETK